MTPHRVLEATGTMIRQWEPEGNWNHQLLHQPPFSSPCFLGSLKSALVVPPYGVLLSSMP